MKNIYLIGYMGAGKSMVSAELSKKLPLKLVEMDLAIESLCAMSIPEIFATMGEEGFRQQETMLLKQLSQEENQIISCGGGLVLRQENVDIMKATGTVILLTANPETIYGRIKDSQNRPLLKDRRTVEGIAAMMEERLPFYEAAKDYAVTTDNKTIDQVAADIITTLAMNDKLV